MEFNMSLLAAPPPADGGVTSPLGSSNQDEDIDSVVSLPDVEGSSGVDSVVSLSDEDEILEPIKVVSGVEPSSVATTTNNDREDKSQQ